MTILKEEKKEIERVCGEDYTIDDIPRFWRMENIRVEEGEMK